MAFFSRKLKTKFINFYPPYLGAGIWMTHLADDFTSCDVRMKLRWWNKNAVGTHFGGSLYAMTDPFYMLLLLQTLSAKEYIIWDKAATIRFRRPGKGTVYAHFSVPMTEVKRIRREVDAVGKKDFTFVVEVKDEAGAVVAEVEKIIYVRKK